MAEATSAAVLATFASDLPSNSCRWPATHSSMRSVSSSTSMPLARKPSRCGLLRAAAKRIGGQVVNGLLIRLHARHILLERDCRGIAARRGRVEAQQLRDPLLLAGSSMMPSFSTTPKVFQNSAYSSRLVRGQILEQIQRALDQRGLDLLDRAIVLQQLARHVQRQVGRSRPVRA